MASETLPKKGVYTLVILLNRKIRLDVNRLGSFDLEKGHYAYTGSALGDGATSLTGRIERHLRKRKTRHWHIDFLLAREEARVVAVVAAESNRNKECQANEAIKGIRGATIPVAGFGASDCKHHCKSHLVHCGGENVRDKIVGAYMNLFGKDVSLSFCGAS